MQFQTKDYFRLVTKFIALVFFVAFSVNFFSCSKKIRDYHYDFKILDAEEITNAPSVKVLCDGKDAFPQILELCAQAQESIYICMYI